MKKKQFSDHNKLMCYGIKLPTRSLNQKRSGVKPTPISLLQVQRFKISNLAESKCCNTQTPLILKESSLTTAFDYCRKVPSKRVQRTSLSRTERKRWINKSYLEIL